MVENELCEIVQPPSMPLLANLQEPRECAPIIATVSNKLRLKNFPKKIESSVHPQDVSGSRPASLQESESKRPYRNGKEIVPGEISNPILESNAAE